MDQVSQQPTTNTGKSAGKKIILISFGLLVAGTASYFGYEHWKKKKEEKATADAGNDTPELNITPPSKNSFSVPAAASIPMRNDDFPLKNKSKGAKVKQVQQVLIAKLGAGILGKAGADGDFGSKTEAALIKAGYPTIIDESTFNVMLQGDTNAAASGFDADVTANQLYTAASKKDFSGTIKSLQILSSKEDYTSVSESFKNNYRMNGVHQTLVNGVLGSFTDAKQKQAIRLQFTRMGLNYDGKKWSLSGLNSNSIITNQATIVWEHPKKGIKVPASMVLGKEVAQRGTHTLFENNGHHFLVKTKTINYL
jgi:peptidoglycan hydrolase-like protein with peptidoglycan-binding domain